MPRSTNQPTRESIETRLAQVSEFESGFERSSRGNLWCLYDGYTVSVFKRRDGRFGWCIAASDDEKQFSPSAYESEEEALAALGFELGVGR